MRGMWFLSVISSPHRQCWQITGVPENVGEARATIEQLTEAQVRYSRFLL